MIDDMADEFQSEKQNSRVAESGMDCAECYTKMKMASPCHKKGDIN